MKKTIYIIAFICAFANAHSAGVFKNVGAYIKVTENTALIVKDADISNNDDILTNGIIEANNNSFIIAQQNFFNNGDLKLNDGAHCEVDLNYENTQQTYINLLSFLIVVGNVVNTGNIMNEHIIEIGE